MFRISGFHIRQNFTYAKSAKTFLHPVSPYPVRPDGNCRVGWLNGWRSGCSDIAFLEAILCDLHAVSFYAPATSGLRRAGAPLGVRFVTQSLVYCGFMQP